MKNILKFLLVIFAVFDILPVLADDIQNLKEYFEYLPNEVHKNWAPYKANADYEVVVQFRVNKNGEISAPQIVSSTNKKADKSVIDAVKKAAPYKQLPKTYSRDSIKTQVELKYIKQN